jgi:hypothetical protein
MRKVAGWLFGYMGPRKAEFAEIEAAYEGNKLGLRSAAE